MSTQAEAQFVAHENLRWEDALQIDREALSRLLIELGVDLQTDLAPSYMLATQDILMCVELAYTLPQEADYLAACSVLHTISNEQPEPVQLVQQAVARNYLGALDESARVQERIRALLTKLDL